MSPRTGRSPRFPRKRIETELIGILCSSSKKMLLERGRIGLVELEVLTSFLLPPFLPLLEAQQLSLCPSHCCSPLPEFLSLLKMRSWKWMLLLFVVGLKSKGFDLTLLFVESKLEE